MKFTMEEKEYRIVFRHDCSMVKVHDRMETTEIHHWVTFCEIVPVGESPANRIAHGWASCHDEDNFCKETGRKISLTRAVAQMPRESRRIIWKAYFGRRNDATIKTEVSAKA